MNKSMIMGVVLGAGVATAGGTYAGYQMLKEANSAEVVKTLDVTKKVKIPHEACAEHAVVHQRQVKDPNRVAGKAIGAVVGGVLGHQVGGGNGKKVAAVAGAVAGGYAGDRVQDNMQKKDTYTTMETVCETTYEIKEEVVAYDVTYRIDDKDAVVRMTYDPGSRIPLKNGELVLNQDKHTSTR
jgi:uncharacterized protein YcfJ